MDPIQKHAIYNERRLHIICIGAGASGLLLAYKLQRSFDNFSLTIYEKNPELSGTWFENKYPGCACDVPAHNYTYSFEPKHDWSTVYATGAEIKRYFESFGEKYKLQKYIKTQHEVQGARWLESDGKWSVSVLDISTGQVTKKSCHILINAGGYLNKWSWPQVKGLETFRGKLLHSANWDDSIRLQGKRVGLIGNGSSGIQILPAIQPIVGELITFIRSPNWILPSISAEEQQSYTEEDVENFRKQPDQLMTLRKRNEAVVNSIFTVYIQGTALQDDTRQQLTLAMKHQLRNSKLAEKLIPSFGVGCRRAAPGLGYLESLQQANVKVVHSGVVELTESGCKCDDGNEYETDVIICATGFDTSFQPRFPIIGSEGSNLQKAWAEVPESYLGIAEPGFPNLLMFLGPHSPVGNGPTLAAIETQADHMLMLIDRWQTENIYSFAPKRVAVDDFMEHARQFLKTTVWADSCRSGHKGHSVNGRIPCLWPGSTLHYIEALRELRADDWDIRYKGNRFEWLGNGLSQTEFDLTSDLGYYIRSNDDSPFASRRRRREVLTRSGTQPARVLHKVHRPTIVKL